MQVVMESSDKNLESIAKKIIQKLIPDLNKETFLMDTKIQDSKFLTLESN